MNSEGVFSGRLPYKSELIGLKMETLEILSRSVKVLLNYVSSLGQAIGFITASKGKGLLFF